MKFAKKPIQHYPHLRQVATLPWEIKKSLFVDIQQTWKKIHFKFKCTNFNSSMRVAVDDKCIYVLNIYNI